MALVAVRLTSVVCAPARASTEAIPGPIVPVPTTTASRTSMGSPEAAIIIVRTLEDPRQALRQKVDPPRPGQIGSARHRSFSEWRPRELAADGAADARLG